MSLALFDILEGRFGGTVPVESVPVEEHLVQSIVGNLQRLFNTRQGGVPHLLAYGLPDLATIHREAPTSIETLRKELRESVMKYEPRLTRVRVETEGVEVFKMRLTFIISGEVAPGKRVRFETVFGSQEATYVRPA